MKMTQVIKAKTHKIRDILMKTYKQRDRKVKT